MQNTSDLWKRLIRQHNTQREFAFEINGEWYGSEAEISHHVTGELFERFGVGNVCTAKLEAVFEVDEIPANAEIRRYVRLVSGDTEECSEWLPQGVFYVKRRAESDGIWSIEAYDALRRTGGKYVREVDEEEWPQPADVIVEKIARRMGLVDADDNVLLDARNAINPHYMVESPGDRIVAEVLSAIAAAHFGNFIMSDAGKLRLVPLLGLPAETNYLVDEHGDPIVLGGVRILV